MEGRDWIFSQSTQSKYDVVADHTHKTFYSSTEPDRSAFDQINTFFNQPNVMGQHQGLQIPPGSVVTARLYSEPSSNNTQH